MELKKDKNIKKMLVQHTPHKIDSDRGLIAPIVAYSSSHKVESSQALAQFFENQNPQTMVEVLVLIAVTICIIFFLARMLINRYFMHVRWKHGQTIDEEVEPMTRKRKVTDVQSPVQSTIVNENNRMNGGIFMYPMEDEPVTYGKGTAERLDMIALHEMEASIRNDYSDEEEPDIMKNSFSSNLTTPMGGIPMKTIQMPPLLQVGLDAFGSHDQMIAKSLSPKNRPSLAASLTSGRFASPRPLPKVAAAPTPFTSIVFDKPEPANCEIFSLADVDIFDISSVKDDMFSDEEYDEFLNTPLNNDRQKMQYQTIIRGDGITPISESSPTKALGRQFDYYEDDDSYLFDKPLEEIVKNPDCLISKQDDIDLLSVPSGRNSAADAIFRNSVISVEASSNMSRASTITRNETDGMRNNQNNGSEIKRSVPYIPPLSLPTA